MPLLPTGRHRYFLTISIIAVWLAATIALSGCTDNPTTPNVVSAEFDQSLAKTDTTQWAPIFTVDRDSLPEFVHDRYIVVFKPEVRSVPDRASEALAGIAGAELRHVFSNVIRGFSATIPEEALDGLRRNANIKYIEQVLPLYLTDAEGVTQTNAHWHLDRVDQRDLPLNDTYNYFGDGTGVEMWFVDTGINEHSEFGERLEPGFTIVHDGLGDKDCHGHGTQVASVGAGSTVGVAKGATIRSFRIAGCDGQAGGDEAIAAFDWIAENHTPPAIVTYGWASKKPNLIRRTFYYTINSAAKNLVDSGVTLVSGAGNKDTDACEFSPGHLSQNITVGATRDTDSRAFFPQGEASNYGECIDLWAPGWQMYVASHTGPESFVTNAGTSFAGPMVAGMAALLLQSNPNYTPADVQGRLISLSTKDRLSNIGSGSPNRLLYTIDLKATIDGISLITSPGTYTWTANVEGGTGDVSYLWEFRYVDGSWQTVGTAQSYSRSVNPDGQHFELRVTTELLGYERNVDHFVFVEDIDDGCAPGEIIC